MSVWKSSASSRRLIDALGQMTSHGISLRLDESSKWPYHDVGVHCNKEQ